MAKASARLQVHPSSVTNAVDRLETANLARRLPIPSDCGAPLIGIIDAGGKLAVGSTERLNAQVYSQPGVSGDKLKHLVTSSPSYAARQAI